MVIVAYFGEEQRRIPHPEDVSPGTNVGQDSILGRGAGEIGGAPWAVQVDPHKQRVVRSD